GIVSAGSLTIDGAPGFSVPNSVDLSFSNNKIGALTVNAGDVNLHVGNAPGVPLVLSGTVPFSFNLVANNTSVTQNLGPTGALTIGAGEGRFNITTVGSGDVTLNNPANQFLAGMTFTTAGNVNVAASGDFDADGSATGNVLIKASGIFFLSSPISGQNIDISGAGFQDFSGATLIVPAGGRFLVRSSDFTQDSFAGGSIAFGPGAGNINYIVYGGFSGTDPASGNGFYTNQTGSIVVPNTDATAVSKVYDGSPNFAYAQSGTPGSAFVDNPLPTLKEAISSYSLTSTGAFTDKNAGVNKGHTIAATNNTQALGASSGVALYGLSFAGFTRAPGVHVPGTPGSAISQITPKAITSSGIDGIDRVYDATTVVGLNTSAATLNGVVAGDTVSLVFGGASGTMANKNVGVNKAVAVNGLALGGADAGNYTVSETSGATATITPKAITSVGFTGVGRVYDGTTAVAVNGSGASLASVIGGDAVGLNTGGVTGSVGNKNVGVGKPVAIAGVAINGVDAGNYTVSDASNATVTITQRPITSTGISGVDRTYDGTTAVGVNAGAATLNNTIAGDNVALVSAAATGTLADKNAGLAKPVTVNGLALGGTDAPNYSLTDASNATANIAQLVLQASGITATDHVFSGSTTVALNTSGATVVGVLPGDTVGVDASGAVGSVATPDPGAAKPVTVTGITLTGPDAIDYSVSPTPIGASGGGLTVRILSIDQGRFDDIRFKEYLQGVSDAQEPFRRAMLEALLSGFGKENIRKQLQRGLVFETGLAPPAVDIIESAKPPEPCTPASGAGLSCGR
ncbi:MAG TPA: YDG domain-containing protein, partial [Caldimonas sp.]